MFNMGFDKGEMSFGFRSVHSVNRSASSFLWRYQQVEYWTKLRGAMAREGCDVSDPTVTVSW